LCLKYFLGLIAVATWLAIAGPNNNFLRLAGLVYLSFFGYHSYVKAVALRADDSIVAINLCCGNWILQLANGGCHPVQLIERSSVVTARFMALHFKAENEEAIAGSAIDTAVHPASKTHFHSILYLAVSSFVIKSFTLKQSYSCLLFADSAAGNDLRLLRLALLHGDERGSSSKADKLIVK